MNSKNPSTILAQCPYCYSLKVVWKGYPGYKWQFCVVHFPKKEQEICGMCKEDNNRAEILKNGFQTNYTNDLY